MVAKKGGTTVDEGRRGLFHLFKWKHKFVKMLFSSSPEGVKLANRSKKCIPSQRLHSIDEVEEIGMSTIKDITNYGCASSVTNEEGCVMKAPRVVARLMGLDSMPCSGVPKSYCTPSYDQCSSFQDTHNLNSSIEYSTNDHSRHAARRDDGYIHKAPLDSRDQSMSRKMIERFELGALPRSSIKHLSMSHRKMMYPIKNPGFNSARNVAQIKEAYPKIVQPNQQMSSQEISILSFPSRIPFKVSEPRQRNVTPERMLPRQLQLSRATTELKDKRFCTEQHMDQSWNCEKDIVMPSIDSYQIKNPSFAKSNKRKSVYVVSHAKVSVQKRECFDASRRNSGVYKHNDESRTMQNLITQSERKDKKQQKKLSSYGTYPIIRQNNHKQHSFVSRDKLAPIKTFSAQQGKKVIGGDSASRRMENGSNAAKLRDSKDIMVTISADWEGPMSYNHDFAQNNIFTKRNSSNEKFRSVSEKITNKPKHVQPNVAMDKHIKWTNGAKDSADAVSFTFTSNFVAPSAGASRFVGKSDTRNNSGVNAIREKGYSDKNPEGLSLSLLLENKLKELTLKNDMFINLTRGEHFVPPASTLDEEPVPGWGMENGVFDFSPARVKPSQYVDYCQSAQSSTKGQILGCHKLEVEEPEEYISIGNASEGKCSECCWSSECPDGSDDSKEDPSYFQVENIPRISISTEEYIGYILSSVNHTKDELGPIRKKKEDELGPLFVNREGSALDPLLFDTLEEEMNTYTEWKGLMKDRVYRQLLFDCSNECLETRRLTYFREGYAAWSKGIIALSRGIETEVCDEISGWNGMGDLAVDELVEKDMSSGLGRWVDFRVEAFEVGKELEREILSSLLDEVISDVCVGLGRRQQCQLEI
ncbi:hypothetical protein ACQ4PT_031619 [Festuca glaucescens]